MMAAGLGDRDRQLEVARSGSNVSRSPDLAPPALLRAASW
ncbi:Hypothetical protein A7982_03274 [Minicystis rosea]|nr:Hypothetical protein A7982_03274 [Minicystis rosea]